MIDRDTVVHLACHTGRLEKASERAGAVLTRRLQEYRAYLRVRDTSSMQEALAELALRLRNDPTIGAIVNLGYYARLEDTHGT